LEIEGIDIDDAVDFPEWIEKEILMEVTGNPKFTNYELAEPEAEETQDDYGDDDPWASDDDDDDDENY
jgi:CYTH domain-containing protein